MSGNPWLKKNPLMSMWLSGANSVANRARGQVTAAVNRQSTTMANKATKDVLSLWTGALTGGRPAAKARSKKRR